MQDRVTPLEGVRNFRDFGGYRTDEGRTIARKVLYRSAHFHDVTGSDQAQLDALGVRLMVDLRRSDEREHEPNRWPQIGVRVLSNDAGLQAPPPHEGAAAAGDWSVAGVHAFMKASYTAYPYEPRYVALFGDFLRGLAETDGAVVVHCAAGKDRTGCLVALTQRLLGVDEETVVADYDFTNQAVDLDALLPIIRERIAARYGVHPNEDALRTMMGVTPDYLAAYFTAIGERFSDVRVYADQVLGVDRATQERIKARVLAP